MSSHWSSAKSAGDWHCVLLFSSATEQSLGACGYRYLTFVYVCTCIYIFVCGGVHIHMCVLGSQRSNLVCESFRHCSSFLRWPLTGTWACLIRVVWLGRKPRNLLVCLPTADTNKPMLLCPVLTLVLGNQTWLHVLVEQALHWLSHVSRPHVTVYKNEQFKEEIIGQDMKTWAKKTDSDVRKTQLFQGLTW